MAAPRKNVTIMLAEAVFKEMITGDQSISIIPLYYNVFMFHLFTLKNKFRLHTLLISHIQLQ